MKLILTGWGHKDYSIAAALALRQHRNADILGMSMRRLPDFLHDVTGYGEIIILGIGLSGDPDRLREALEELATLNTKVTWISSLPVPKYIGEGIRKRMQLVVDLDASGITEAVSRFYQLSSDDLACYLHEKSRSERVQKVHLLLNAAMYMYRNYQDEKAYGNAIRHIANGDGETQWTPAEHKMIDHYLRVGSRELVGKSAVMMELIDRVNRIAPKEHARVLIHGETGTGKETVALQLHSKSPRKDEAFIAFNCASVSTDLLESRFLGYEKGAFTGANERRLGIFEQANGGTLFLDEIGELPMEAQGLLLRVLEGGRFTRIGEKEEVVVDVRLIAATHRDLAGMVRKGTFREDLFHRLNVIQVRIPPLREHKEDIGPIANAYWRNHHHQPLAPEQIEALMTYDYPGNVRELFNLLERAGVLGENDFSKLLEEHRQLTASLKTKDEVEVPDNLEQMTRLHVKWIYEKCGNNLTKTAEALGVARNTVRKYLG